MTKRERAAFAVALFLGFSGGMTLATTEASWTYALPALAYLIFYAIVLMARSGEPEFGPETGVPLMVSLFLCLLIALVEVFVTGLHWLHLVPASVGVMVYSIAEFFQVEK